MQIISLGDMKWQSLLSGKTKQTFAEFALEVE